MSSDSCSVLTSGGVRVVGEEGRELGTSEAGEVRGEGILFERDDRQLACLSFGAGLLVMTLPLLMCRVKRNEPADPGFTLPNEWRKNGVRGVPFAISMGRTACDSI